MYIHGVRVAQCLFSFPKFLLGLSLWERGFFDQDARELHTQERPASLAKVCLDLKRRLGRWMRYIERTSAMPASVMGLSVCQ